MSEAAAEGDPDRFSSLLELLVELLLCTRHFAGSWESTDGKQTKPGP